MGMRHRPLDRTRALLCAALLAAAPLAQAAHGSGDGDALVDLGLENLLGLKVYTASRFPQARAEAPSALTVITAEQIALYGFRRLDDILRSIPGIHTSYDHIYRYIGVRGVRRPQDFNSPVLLLVDGQRLNDGVYDTAAIGTDFPVDIELIDRVEFIRGPGSAAYGSNALLGVVNVITRDPARTRGGRARLDAGDAGALHSSVQTDVPLGDAAALLLSASYGKRDGEDIYVPAFDDAEHNNGISHGADGERRKRFMTKLSAGDWQFQLAHGERIKSSPLPIYGADFGDPRNRYSDRNSFASTSYETDLDDDWQLRARLSNSYYRFAGSLVYDGAINVDRGTGRRWNAESQLQYRGWRHHRLLGGVEWTHDYRQDQLNYDESPYTVQFASASSSRSHGLFFQDEWRLRENLQLSSGLRYDNVRGEGVTSPRLAVILQPARGHNLKLLYGRAFRAPSAYERLYAGANYAANPDLAPERTTNIDLHWEAFLDPSLKLQVSLQNFEIKSFIIERKQPDSGNLQYFNGQPVHSRSADLGLEKYWQNGIAGRISLSVQEVRNEDGSELVDAPRLLSKLYLSSPLPWLSANAALEVQGVGKRNSLTGETAAYALGNFTLSSARLSRGLTLNASVYNILDRVYADPLSDDLADQGVSQATQRGREFRVGLGWEF